MTTIAAPPHLLIVGDAVRSTGFARITHALAEGLTARGWRVSILAVNYSGDPTPLQRLVDLYPAGANGSDPHGLARLPHVVTHTKPDAVLFINDPWIVDDYLGVLEAARLDHQPKLAAYMPVDGPGLNPAEMQRLVRLDAPIAYTDFGAVELAQAGLEKQIFEIPHGIDRSLFRPGDRAEARRLMNIDQDACVVFLCDSNSWRKRLDVVVKAFAHFARSVPEAHLLINSTPLARNGWDLPWLCRRAGIEDRLLWARTSINLLSDAALHIAYCASDMRVGAGCEGWGYTYMESMACGIPTIGPRWSALAEWARDGAYLVDCDPELTLSSLHDGGQEHGVPTPQNLARAMLRLWRDQDRYQHYVDAGLACVSDPRYEWPGIIDQFDAVLRQILPGADQAHYALEREAAHVIG